jgi:hypothetical protein
MLLVVVTRPFSQREWSSGGRGFESDPLHFWHSRSSWRVNGPMSTRDDPPRSECLNLPSKYEFSQEFLVNGRDRVSSKTDSRAPL